MASTNGRNALDASAAKVSQNQRDAGIKQVSLLADQAATVLEDAIAKVASDRRLLFSFSIGSLEFEAYNEAGAERVYVSSPKMAAVSMDKQYLVTYLGSLFDSVSKDIESVDDSAKKDVAMISWHVRNLIDVLSRS